MTLDPEQFDPDDLPDDLKEALRVLAALNKETGTGGVVFFSYGEFLRGISLPVARYFRDQLSRAIERAETLERAFGEAVRRAARREN